MAMVPLRDAGAAESLAEAGVLPPQADRKREAIVIHTTRVFTIFVFIILSFANSE
jgi:hypothetical protein